MPTSRRTAIAITESGALVFFRLEVPRLRTMVFIADPAGAVLGAWQPSGHPGFDPLSITLR